MKRFFIAILAIVMVLMAVGASALTRGLIGKQDMSLWDGTTTRTFTRSTTGGYTLTLRKFDWPGVDVLQSAGGGVNYTAATINSAITTLGSEKAILYLAPGTWTIGADVSGTSNIVFAMPQGAKLSVSSGFTFTAYSPAHIAAMPSQNIMTGAGTLAFTRGGVVYPEWWGAIADNATDSASAINSAVTAIYTAGDGVVEFPNPGGTYKIGSKIQIPNDASDITIEGNHSTISGVSLSVTHLNIGDTSGYGAVTDIRVNDLTITGAGYAQENNTNYPNQNGILIGNSQKVVLDNVYVANMPGRGIYGEKAASDLGGGRYWNGNALYNCKVTGTGREGLVSGATGYDDASWQTADDIQIYNCIFNTLGKGKNTSTTHNSKYAGVILNATTVNWFGGEIANVYHDNSTSGVSGAEIGLYTSAHDSGTIAGVHFERIGNNQLNSWDARIEGDGLVLQGTTHNGNHGAAARGGIRIGSADNVTVISPSFNSGSTRSYTYGVLMGSSHHAQIINPRETDASYPPTTLLTKSSSDGSMAFVKGAYIAGVSTYNQTSGTIYGSGVTIDLQGARNHIVNLVNGTATNMAFINAIPGAEGWLKLLQDSTGSATVVWAGKTALDSGVSPTLTTRPNGYDIMPYIVFSGTTVDILSGSSSVNLK